MKLLVGAFAYLALVGTLLAATFAGIFSVERSRPDDPPVLARSDEDTATRTPALADDPDRVPVWIAPTPKYAYTPPPPDERPARNIVISDEARNAMARAQPDLEREPQEVRRSAAPRRLESRRDNDPFYRD